MGAYNSGGQEERQSIGTVHHALPFCRPLLISVLLLSPHLPHRTD